MSPPPESIHNLLRRPPQCRIRSPPLFNIASTNPATSALATAAVGRGHGTNRTHGDITSHLDGAHGNVTGDMNCLLGRRDDRTVQLALTVRTTGIDLGTEQGNSQTSNNTHFHISFLFNATTGHDTTCHSAPGRRHLPSGSCPNPGCRCCSSGSCHSQHPRTFRCNPTHDP